MKFIVPIKKEDNEDTTAYYGKCNLWLMVFKRNLKNSINQSKIISKKEALLNVPCINWTIDNTDYNIISILDKYINNLYCYYDYYECCCYYKVPENIRCPYTKDTLNKVVRILEYGALDLQPLFWLRSTYTRFVKTTIDIKNK